MLRCAEGAARHVTPLRATEAGRALASLLSGAAVPVMLERSFRLTAAGVEQGRFLLSVPVRAAPRGLLDGLAALGLPARGLAAARLALEDAVFLHLGLEEGPLLKLYLERPDGLAADGGAGPPLHRAWKWQPGEDRLATDRYVLVPPGEAAERLALVPALLQPALRAALALLEARPGWLFMLDVLGEGPRRSLDIRTYDFERSVGDLWAPVTAAATALGTPPAALAAALALHRDDALGHLAWGIGRGGQPFLTVYAGAEACDPALLA